VAFTYKHGDTPLAGYVIQRGVGRGGFGEVYYALSEGGKEVALKYLRENPQIELRGVSHCVNLKSPHLVTIYDVKQNAEGEYFIVMEYVHGPSLRDLLVAEPDGLGMQKAAFFVSEIAKGLSYLHDRGIIHRDMKPGNIFYEDGYVKIGDYGLSKFISLSRHSGQTASIGTVHYMAPEVGSGNYHRGIDIYALGVMLYEMLLGKVPFEGSSMGEVLMKHLTEQPEVEALPAPFAEVIRKALAKDPKDRYQSVDEMAQDILGAEQVRKSIANFKPGSLTSIARQAMETQAMDSPHPSPHGQAAPSPAVRAGRPKPPPGRQANDVLDAQAFSNRLAHRMERLGGRRGYGPPTPAAYPGGPDMPTPAGQILPPAAGGGRIQGLLVSAIVALGLSVGIALLAGARRTIPEHTMIIFGFIVAIRLGVFLAERVARRMAAPASSAWATRLITLACCTIPVAIMGAATRDALGCFYGEEACWALALAVLISSGAVDWIKRVRHGMMGRVEFKDAVKAGLFGLIVGAILEPGCQFMMVMSAGIAAATSLSIQAAALFRRPLAAAPWSASGEPPGGPEPGRAKKNDEAIGPAALGDDETPGATDYLTDPLQGYQPTSERYAQDATGEPARGRRSRGGRLFWGLLSVMLLYGTAVCGLGTRMVADTDEETMGFLIGAACSLIMAVFTLLKTTRHKRFGFWNETARPLLACMFLSGAAAQGLVLGFLPTIQDDQDAQLGVITGLVVCAVFGLLCAFIGGRGHRAATDHHGVAAHGRDRAGDYQAAEGSAAAMRGDITPRPRPVLFRAFWAIVSAALLCGAGVCGLAIGLMAHNDEEMMGFTIGAACCGIMAIFALLKTTIHKRRGFWNETLRPFFACLFFSGVAALGCVIGFLNLGDDALFGVLSGLIPCAVFALLATFIGGRKHAHAHQARPRRSRALVLFALVLFALLVGLIGIGLMHALSRNTVSLTTWAGPQGAWPVPLLPAAPAPPAPHALVAKGYHRVQGAEDLFYKWHQTRDGKSLEVSLLSESYRRDLPLLYTLRNGKGIIAEENVFLDLDPGESAVHNWHTGFKIHGGELRVRLLGSPND